MVGTSTDQNPSHIFNNEGTYVVSLTAGNEAGENSGDQRDHRQCSRGHRFTGAPPFHDDRPADECPFSDLHATMIGDEVVI